MNKKKNKLGIIYSTNPNFEYQYETNEETQTLPPPKQKLYIKLDKKNRNGKIVTIVSNFIGTQEDLENLCKIIKNKCATGGTIKDNEIIIQGNLKEKINNILQELGYKTIIQS